MKRSEMYVGQLVTRGLQPWATWYKVKSTTPHDGHGFPTKGGRYVLLHPGKWDERRSIFTENEDVRIALKPSDLNEAGEWRVARLDADVRALERKDKNSDALARYDALVEFFTGLGFSRDEIDRRILIPIRHTTITGDEWITGWSWTHAVEKVLPRVLVELGVLDELDEPR